MSNSHFEVSTADHHRSEERSPEKTLATSFFVNQILDKKGTKKILSWFLDQYGPTRTSQFLEELKSVGFHFATLAGISLGFDDLKIPHKKVHLLQTAEQQIQACEQRFQQGKLTAVERYQKVITLWTTASENLKDEVIQSFQSTDLLNPLYMMAFSGARGNISQVRQLVGMRGLMSDSSGGIIDFPIRRNFREGLTVTEYAISCYGARKGLIDTALRTADSGYLTRRLVDVAHGIMIGRVDCRTDESFEISPLRTSTTQTGFGKSGILLSLEKRILGRVLAQDVIQSTEVMATKNQEITSVLAHSLAQVIASQDHTKQKSLLIRSPLTCKHFQNFREDICQLCYGWSLSQGRLVSLGEAVGILAAQSIGEPGTQLTMRTFHTGGIFSTDIDAKLFAPHGGRVMYSGSGFHKGKKIRTLDGETGFFLFEPLQLKIQAFETVVSTTPTSFATSLDGDQATKQRPEDRTESIFFLPAQSIVFVYPGQKVKKNTLCAEISYFQQSDSARTYEENKILASVAPKLADLSSELMPRTDRSTLMSELDIRLTHSSTDLSDEGSAGKTQPSSIPTSFATSLLGQRTGASQAGSSYLKRSEDQDEDDFATKFAGGFDTDDHEKEVIGGEETADAISSGETSFEAVQTKKVLSEIEGQIYFANPQASLLWVLSGSKTQRKGPCTTGDFFSSQSKSIHLRSVKPSLESSKPASAGRYFIRGQVDEATPSQLHGERLHGESWIFSVSDKGFHGSFVKPFYEPRSLFAQAIFCTSLPRTADHEHRGPLCGPTTEQHRHAPAKLASEASVSEANPMTRTKLAELSSIFLFSDRSELPQNQESSSGDGSYQVSRLIARKSFQYGLWSHFLCFSQRKESWSGISTMLPQNLRNRFRDRLVREAINAVGVPKQDTLLIFQKQVRTSFEHEALLEALLEGSKKRKNLERFYDPQAATRSAKQKRNSFGEFRSSMKEMNFVPRKVQATDFSGRENSTADVGLFLQKNHCRRMPARSALLTELAPAHQSPGVLVKELDCVDRQFIHDLGHFLPAAQKCITGKTDDETQSAPVWAVDTSVHLLMDASSKYAAADTSGRSQTFRRVHPYLISKESKIHVHHGESVSSRQFLFELFFEQSKTGDIVQGLPKIEQLFEARRTSLHVQETIHKKLKQKYFECSQMHSCFEATYQSIRYIQRLLIDEIQTVYQSQGVDIADKHLEIIVRQMTSKVIVHETKQTSFFPGDVVDFYKIKAMIAATKFGPASLHDPASLHETDLDFEIMEPLVLGITKVAFLTESFVSAASFQEAKRVLMDAALESRVDFLYGLKENVIVGRFIRAGTGFQVDVFPQLSSVH